MYTPSGVQLILSRSGELLRRTSSQDVLGVAVDTENRSIRETENRIGLA